MTKTQPSERPPAATASTIASWSATIVRALDARGLDGAAIAARAGIDAATLADADGRVPRAALTRLWELAVEESGDPAFGLEAARHTLQTTFHALGYAVLASTTMREAVERIIRYRRLIGEILQLRLEDHGDASRLVVDVSAGRGVVPPQAVDAFMAVMVRQARLLQGGRSSPPRAVSLERSAPEDDSPYLRAFGTTVSFAQPANFLEYARDDLDRRLPSANAELARQNDEVVVRYLARLEQSGVLVKTRQALLESLPSGAPTKPGIARRLGMSPRSLQRMLAGEGTSFTDLLAEARLTLAKSYLDEGRLPVTEIAFVLGFADTSAFSRAFRRWTGVAPSDYGKRGNEPR
jgi:AraC-like DNA-binding protein